MQRVLVLSFLLLVVAASVVAISVYLLRPPGPSQTPVGSGQTAVASGQPTTPPKWTIADAAGCADFANYLAPGTHRPEDLDRFRVDPAGGQDVEAQRQAAATFVGASIAHWDSTSLPSIIPNATFDPIKAAFTDAQTRLAQPLQASDLNAVIDSLQAAIRPAIGYCDGVIAWVKENVRP